jgi:DNA helicase-2/ATP-dependent DNA helicase PcrA
MTRAEANLYLTSSRYRRSFGMMDPMVSEVSRFLGEIPQELIDGLAQPGLRDAAPKERSAYSGTAYNSVDAVQGFLAQKGGKRPSSGSIGRGGRWKQGTRVRHPKYGVGTVLRLEGAGDDAKLTVSFTNYGMKKLVARYASLEVV